MKLKVMALLLTVSNSSYADVCPKLQQDDIDLIDVMANHLSKSCQDKDFQILIPQNDKELIPLQKISVSKKDMSQRLIVSKNKNLLLDGKKLDSTKLSIFIPHCEGEKFQNGYIKPLSCTKDFNIYQAYDEKDPQKIFAEYETLNTPFFKQANNLCLEKIQKTIKDKVIEYIKLNKGTVKSFEAAKELYSSSNRSPRVQWQTFNIEVQNKNKVSTLSLKFPLLNDTLLVYNSNATDAFGEKVSNHERAATAFVKYENLKYGWHNEDVGQNFEPIVASLSNSKTKVKLLDISFANFNCKEVVSFNDRVMPMEVAAAAITKSEERKPASEESR